MKYYRTAQHRCGLKESLETEQPIQEKTFKILLKAKIYKFYAYDERIKANCYILNVPLDKNYGLPLWIHEYE